MSTSDTAPTTGPQPLLSNGMYDTLKRAAAFLLPAIGALYFAVAAIWGLPEADKVVGTIAAINTFIGAVVLFSDKSYQASDASNPPLPPTAGVINISQSAAGVKTFSLDLNAHPDELEAMKAVSFSVNNNPEVV